MNNQYCAYYIGHVKREKVWLFTAILRGTEHVVFDRTIDAKESLFEFFVPIDMELIFLELVDYFKKEGLLLSFIKQKNRLLI